MSGRSADQIHGLEFDWLACDVDDHAAFFSTAGGGYAPEEFLRDTDAHDAAIAAILSTLASTKARFAPELLAGLENTWRNMAERGIFAFDSDLHEGPYRLVAASEAAVRVAELPASAAAAVRPLTLLHLKFTALPSVSAELLRLAAR